MDNQEFNNQGGETKSSVLKNPLVIIAIVIVIALIIFVAIGLINESTDTQVPTNTESELTPEELAELENLLSSSPDTPELTPAEQAELERLLGAPTDAPELTPEELAELEGLLSQ